MYNQNLWNKGKTGIYSIETRIQMSKSKKGLLPWNTGKKLGPLSEECKLKISNALKGSKSPHFGKPMSIETKRKISKTLTGTKLSLETISKLSGKNSHNWKGGSSFEPYCTKFNNKFKESIRVKFNRTCLLCGKTEAEQMELQINNNKSPYKLSIHHVSYDKTCLCENMDCKFVPLCISCHSKTNHNRNYYENLIINILESHIA